MNEITPRSPGMGRYISKDDPVADPVADVAEDDLIDALDEIDSDDFDPRVHDRENEVD